jgi:hypothetical protein
VDATESVTFSPTAHPLKITFALAASSPTTVLDVFGALRLLAGFAPTVLSAGFVVGAGGGGGGGLRSVSPAVDCEVNPPDQNQLFE